MFIHLAYFEIHVHDTRRNWWVVKVLHGVSFNGSILIFVLATVMMVENPGFIVARSREEHLPLWLSITAAIYLHVFPVIVHGIDMALSRQHLRRSHHLFLRCSPLSILHLSLSCCYTYVVPITIMLVWRILGFTPEKVYGVNFPDYASFPIAFSASLVGTFLWVVLTVQWPSERDSSDRKDAAAVNDTVDDNADMEALLHMSPWRSTRSVARS